MEQMAWRQHFEKFPHGDFYTQKLLADLVSMLGSFLSSKEIQPRDVAPWLYSTQQDTNIKQQEVITPPAPENDLILKSLQARLDQK